MFLAVSGDDDDDDNDNKLVFVVTDERTFLLMFCVCGNVCVCVSVWKLIQVIY